MSMWMSLVRVTPRAFETLKDNPDLLEGVLMEPDSSVMAELGIADGDVAGLDYRTADEMLAAMGEVEMEDDVEDDPDAAGPEAEAPGTIDPNVTLEDDSASDDDAVLVNLCVDGSLDYEATYGPAFTISPSSVKRAMTSSLMELDGEVKKLFADAAERGDYVVGVVS